MEGLPTDSLVFLPPTTALASCVCHSESEHATVIHGLTFKGQGTPHSHLPGGAEMVLCEAYLPSPVLRRASERWWAEGQP